MLKRFDRKVAGGIALLVLLFVPLVIYGIYATRRIVADQDRLIAEYTEELLLARDLRHYVTSQTAVMPVFVLNGDLGLLKNFKISGDQFLNTLTRLEGMKLSDHARATLGRIRRLHDELMMIAQPGISLKKDGASIAQVNGYFHRTVGPLAQELTEEISDFVADTSLAFERERANNDHISRQIIRVLAFGAAATLLSCLGVAALLMKLLRERRLQDEVNEMYASKLRRLSDARKETVEVVAHDLKNPLSSIAMSTELSLMRLDDPNASPADVKENLKLTMRATDSMRRLINDLLDHAKIESSSFVLDVQGCRFEPFVQNILLRFKPLAEREGLTLSSKFENLPVQLDCDAGRIEQVLSNFIGNALKFTPTGGHIEVIGKTVTDSKGERLRISVRDDGPGMNDEAARHVFDRYWQVRETASQGTGLGLAIAKAIVTAHGGEIGVITGIGKGSTFYFEIPVVIESLEVPLHPEPYQGFVGTMAT